MSGNWNNLVVIRGFVRNMIDSRLLPKGDLKTRWIRYVPNKVNTFAWKVMTNSLPTRFNISRRGIDIESLSCVNCDVGIETNDHLFFACNTAKKISKLINRWWDVPFIGFNFTETGGLVIMYTCEEEIKSMFQEGLCLYESQSSPSPKKWVMKNDNEWKLMTRDMEDCDDVIHYLTPMKDYVPQESFLSHEDRVCSPKSGAYIDSPLFVQSLVSPHVNVIVNEKPPKRKRQTSEEDNPRSVKVGSDNDHRFF
ncbi:RNA-directed DNA polymerase, eukaryota [Tanacetum coccineum]